jgi:hypothetical protein
MTGEVLITLALKDLGEISGDETPDTDEFTDGMYTLNHIIASWSNEELPTFQRVQTVFAYVVDTDAYTVGATGTWDTGATGTRPMKILSAVSYSGKFRRGMEVLPMGRFRSRIQNGTGITATLPDLLGFDNARPNINVRVFPMPNATSSIELEYWTALAALASKTTDIDYAEGWELALRDELVLRLAPMYGKEASQTQIRNAQASKSAIAAIVASTMAAEAPAQA